MCERYQIIGQPITRCAECQVGRTANRRDGIISRERGGDNFTLRKGLRDGNAEWVSTR